MLQKDLLSEFLDQQGLGIKAARVRNMSVKRLQMPWRDAVNTRDCGVFLMRHMESFQGQLVAEWDCGFVKGDIQFLLQLRKEYIHTLSTHRLNALRSDNIRRALRARQC